MTALCSLEKQNFPRGSIFLLFRRPKRLINFKWRKTSVTGARPVISAFAVAIQKMSDFGKRSDRILSWLIAFLAISAAYLYPFPQANILYAVIVLLHAVAGVLATIFLIAMLFRLLRSGSFAARAGWFLIAAGAAVGLILIKTGTLRTEWTKLYLHIVISIVGVGLLAASWLGKRRPWSSDVAPAVLALAICFTVLAGIAYGAHYVRESWQTRNRIQNPTMPPDTMNG